MKNSLLTIFFIAFFFFFLPRAYAQPANQTLINGQTTAAENFSGGFVFNWVTKGPSIGLPVSGTGNILPFIAINKGTTPVTDTITATPVPTSFAYVPIADGTRGGIAIINVATEKIGAVIPLSDEPTDVTVNHAGTKAYVCDHDNAAILVINTATNLVSATIPIIAKPLLSVLSPDDGKLYISDYPNITIINTSDNSVITNKPGFNPAGLAISPDGSKLYISTTGGTIDNLIYIMNTTTYNEADDFTAGYNASEIALSLDGSELYVPNDNSAVNHIDVVNTANYNISGTIPTGQFPGRVIFSKDGSTAYVTSQNPSTVSVFNPATNQVITSIPIGGQPSGLALTTDGSELYTINFGSNAVQVISTVTNAVTANITGFSFPISLGHFISPIVTSATGPVTFTITVEPTPPPAIVTGPITGNISACLGTASVSPNIQHFSVSGSYLNGSITATASAGFEVSLNTAGGYASSLMIKPVNGVVTDTVIYVRSSASAPEGSVPGKVLITSAGAAEQSVSTEGTINAIPAVNTPDDQTLLNGAATAAIDFTGTANTYNWTINTPDIGLAAEGTGDIPSFIAINDTYAPVTATITVIPLNNMGCDGIPVKFTITVNPTRIATLTKTDIPNIFTPNGDGKNDTWMIDKITYFPKATVNIFNRWGQQYFHQQDTLSHGTEPITVKGCQQALIIILLT